MTWMQQKEYYISMYVSMSTCIYMYGCICVFGKPKRSIQKPMQQIQVPEHPSIYGLPIEISMHP